MALYKYNALNRQGKSLTGTCDAASLQDAKEYVRAQGLMLISVELSEAAVLARPFLFGLFERRVETKDIIRLTKSLAILLKSGVPLLQALELLAEQFSGKLKRVLIDVKDELKSGQSFAYGIAKYPKIFSTVYVQLVRAGEATGKLEPILERLVSYIEKTEATKKEIRGAMAWPMMIGAFSLGAIIFLLYFVVPQLTSMFKDTGKALPAPTQFLVTISNFITGYFVYIFVFLIITTVGFLYWKSTSRGKQFVDNLKLKLPLASYIAKTKVVVEFSKTLGMLLDSGVHLAEALDIVCNIIDNKVLTDTLKSARDKIIKEGKIALYLRETGIFPPIASYMITTGEQSGELAGMLLNVARDYEIELSDSINSLIAKINPLMLLIMGGIVVFIIIAMFMPVLEMGQIAGF